MLTTHPTGPPILPPKGKGVRVSVCISRPGGGGAAGEEVLVPYCVRWGAVGVLPASPPTCGIVCGSQHIVLMTRDMWAT